MILTEKPHHVISRLIDPVPEAAHGKLQLLPQLRRQTLIKCTVNIQHDNKMEVRTVLSRPHAGKFREKDPLRTFRLAAQL